MRSCWLKRVPSFALVSLCLFVAASGQTADIDTSTLQDGLYAAMETSKGTILLQLYPEKVPMTVTNFVGLAEGTMHSNKAAGVPFYDGIAFHRVLADFMIQGGDPQGNGMGGPGYKFADEFDPSLRHSRPGILSMANSGPNSNGSQFFITHKATPWLDDHHTVLGHVVTGQDVVDSIAKGDRIVHVKIIRKGAAATALKTDQAAFDALQGELVAKQKAKAGAAAAQVTAEIEKRWPDAVSTSSGLRYVVMTPGDGPTPTAGTRITTHYTGYLMNGSKFDSSVDRNQPFVFQVGLDQVIKGWDEAFLGMKKGEKRTLIIPHQLAYGPAGRAPIIPPRATLVFDVELIDF